VLLEIELLAVTLLHFIISAVDSISINFLGDEGEEVEKK